MCIFVVQLGKRPLAKGKPKTLKRVGKMKTQSLMKLRISFWIWKVRFTFEVAI